MKKIAVLGCGTVGSGVAEVFYKNRTNLEHKAGCELDIKYIYVRRPHPELPWQDNLCTDFEQIVNDPEINIVVEVMGGLEPACSFVKRCLQNKKSIVTANKELIAQRGAELLAIAKQNHVNILFEASVGGGIPIIRPLHQCLGANEIDDIQGILNGTTNFILTKMIRSGMSFEEALKQAQQLGYAEADPTADVEGLDACRKICILASLAYGRHIYPELVSCRGISELTQEDVTFAKDWGGVIKLISKATRNPQTRRISIEVAPMLVADENQLSTIDDVFNGILVNGDATGDVLFYGKGAGKLPTASSVISDVIDCAKSPDTIDTLFWENCSVQQSRELLEDISLIPVQSYLRLRLSAKEQSESVCAAFHNPVLLARKHQPETEIAFITPPLAPAELDAILKNLQKQGIALLGKIRLL